MLNVPADPPAGILKIMLNNQVKSLGKIPIIQLKVARIPACAVESGDATGLLVTISATKKLSWRKL
jgi:hypothetical protein